MTGQREGREALRFSALGATMTADPIEPGLHVVATPIGNLADITLRALATLAAADAVLAEDTRVSRVLLTHYGITTPLMAYHEHNAAAMRPVVLERLAEGAAIALISDAGTPLVSDPGFKLVTQAIDAGHKVTAVPGASAVLTALVAAGLPTDRFFFEGFLPGRSGARRSRLAELAGVPATLIFFESARRLPEALEDLSAVFGARPAAVARELTKRFETIARGALPALAAEFAACGPPKGEVVVVVGPPDAGAPTGVIDLDTRLIDAMALMSVKDAAAVVAAETGVPRREAYGRAVALAAQRRRDPP